MFFKSMPAFTYKVNDDTIITKDIFQRVGLDRQIKTSLALESYYIQDGDTPDILANNLYGSSRYHWVLLIVNDITNVHDQWPRRQEELLTYTKEKYGSGNHLNDHHYRLVSDTTITVDYDPAAISNGTVEAVSNFNYEAEINEDKKHIFLLKKDFLARFIVNYKDLMAQ